MPPGSTRERDRVADLALDAIEPIGRARMMDRFDESCIDPRVTLGSVQTFLADPDRLGEAFLGRYAVWTSSGTTGTPGIWIHDAGALAVYDALESLRLCGLGRPQAAPVWLDAIARAPWSGPARYAMVAATGGHFAGSASLARLRRLMPWAAGRMRTLSIMQPLAALVRELDDFSPEVLATYPTCAEVLAAEQQAGRLSIHPREILVGGEQLSDSVRTVVSQAFGCPVRQGYGASECLSIAWDCGHGSLHVNADWVLLEPVDRNGRAVRPGEPSHSVLLTDLANHVQPVIRYDLGDSITPLPGGCACGTHFPRIRVEGRRDELLEFDGEHGAVRLLPLALVTAMEEEAGAFSFQLIARDRRTLVMRVDAQADGRSVPQLRDACRHALRAHLDRHGLARVRIVSDPAPPAREPVSGKLRRVLQEARRPD
jgi:phenylacetate-coenzyme A ligase PaaK-like adenylate-forming protein